MDANLIINSYNQGHSIGWIITEVQKKYSNDTNIDLTNYVYGTIYEYLRKEQDEI